MIRAWLAIAAIGGLLSVAAGTIAAHFPAGDRPPALLRKGAVYGMVHAAALIAVAAIAELRNRIEHPLIVFGWSFAAGTLSFSCSLFGLALTGIEPLTLVTAFRRRWLTHRLDRARNVCIATARLENGWRRRGVVTTRTTV